MTGVGGGGCKADRLDFTYDTDHDGSPSRSEDELLKTNKSSRTSNRSRDTHSKTSESSVSFDFTMASSRRWKRCSVLPELAFIY
ncbi:hypothetical protein CEXT_646221 [Caerostris extrusa]|uniref:Uncharacterized protein n=1 Tax=Caerostris extrusa TaxID=172846 RepID=A0AAV4MVJ2_CAEEX|nr:hypothetical protein CEXT_646221 [Caerostris extrusa]